MAKYHTLKYQIIPLSPIHIGDGEQMDPFRFIVKNKYAHLVNSSAYTDYLLSQDGPKLQQLLDQGVFKPLIKFMWESFDTTNSSLYHYRYPVSDQIQGIVVRQLEEERNQNLVQSFIRTSLQQPFIPGSSIKGSFRTALISALYDIRGKRDRGNGFEFWMLGAVRDERTLVEEDPFKFIKFSDADFDNKHLCIGKVDRIYTKQERQSVTTYAEVLKQSKSPVTHTMFSISPDLFANPAIARLLPNATNINQKLYGLIDMINEYYKSRIMKDRENITIKKHTRIYDEILGQFNSLTTGQFILRIGKGSGRYFISVDNPDLWIPVTKSIADDKTMGWCKFVFTKN